jgi:hypothetical protein
MAKKIIGVDNLNVIRDFVLSKIMAESDDIRRTLTEENADYLHNKLLEASESLKTDYESKYEILNNKLDTLKSEGANADELHELELQIDALNNNYADMQNGLSAIEDSIIDIENSVMSPGQLNELIDTALIERTTITEDMVETPNVYTQNLVALIAKFGTVRALNIVGDEIEGKTISAYDKIEGTDEPTWKLDRQGNGYLANKNISWDKDGNVTFGENVTLSWGAIKDAVEENVNIPTDFGSVTIMFSDILNNPGNPDDNPDNWSEDNTNNTIWMATNTGGGWSVVKIKGADGKDGVDGQDGAPGKDGVNGKDGADGAQVYLHIKYANSIAYALDGKTVISVDWTDDNGEVVGPYQGVYSDYVEDDSMDCTKYKWSQISAERAVQTEIGKYKITSNTISGKTLQTTTKLPLVVNTPFETFDENGLSQGTTTSDGSTEGPAWQLRNLGDGYLAKGNIRWDAGGNVEFGPNVKLGWSNIDGPAEQYKLTANIPYLRRKDSGKLDYNNEKNDPLLSVINDKGTGDKMFTITVKEYNSTTGEYDKSITDTIRLYRLLTYTDGTTHKPGYAEAPNGVYSGPDSQQPAWMNLKNIRLYLIENDTTKCFVDIPVIGYFEEWVGDSGLTKGDVTNIINTTITKDYVESLEVRAKDIIGDTIQGKTIKSDTGAWEITKTGAGHLANNNISWDEDGNMNCNITGTFNGGVNGSIANGKMTWAADGVHVHDNLIFDEGKGISWSDVSGAPDYATKDYVDQNSNGFTTEIGNNWIKTADVTCENLKVSKLNTNYGKDYNTVNAEKNYLKILNGYGDTSLTLTSDDVIDFTLADGQTSVASSSSTSFYKEFSMSKNASGLYCNSGSQTIELGEFTVKPPIGEQAYSVDLDVNIGLGLYNSINALSYTSFMIPKGGEGPQTSSKAQYSLAYNPSYVGRNIRIDIYKKNSDGTIPSSPTHTNYQRTGFGHSQSYPSLSTSTTTANKWMTANLFYNNIDVEGTYVVKLVIPENIITLESGNNYTKTYLCVGYTVKTSGSYDDFVFIGNDGIVVNSDKNTFILNNDGLFMQSGTKSSFYGIKITTSGMYFCNGGNTWRDWDPS